MERLLRRASDKLEAAARGEAAAFLLCFIAGAAGTYSLAPLGPAAVCSARMLGKRRISTFIGACLGAAVFGRWPGLLHIIVFALMCFAWGEGRKKTLIMLTLSGVLIIPFFYIKNREATLEGLAQISASLLFAAAFFRGGRAIDRAKLGRGISEIDMTSLFLTAGAYCGALMGVTLGNISLGGIAAAFISVLLGRSIGVYAAAGAAVCGAGAVLGGAEPAFVGAVTIGAVMAGLLRTGGKAGVCCGFLAAGAIAAYYGCGVGAAIEIAAGTLLYGAMPKKQIYAIGKSLRFGRTEAEERLAGMTGRVKETAVVLDRVSAMMEKYPQSEAELFAGRQLRCVSGAIACIPRHIPENQGKFSLSYGVSSCSKDGSRETGDSMAVRELGGGKLIVLSDGMGTGTVAKRESSSAAALVGDLLSIGADPVDAMDCANRLLLFKGEYDMYATIDAMCFDYLTGRARFLKLGAPPSYILRNGEVTELSAETLPIGIIAAARPARQDMTLKRGDRIIMATDGVTDTLEAAMITLITKLGKISPEDMAKGIIAAACEGGRRDDMFVVVAEVTMK